MWYRIEAIIVKIIYFFTVPTLHILYPHKTIWEDKEATKKVMKKPCIVYSNHTGYSDGLFMLGILSNYSLYTFVGKDWYEKKKINWLFRHLKYIPIDRTQMDTTWLDKGKEVLYTGDSIYFFPEGHTSKDGLIHDFQPGFLMLAKQCDVPLVPICIDRKIEPLKPFRIIIGKPQYPDLHEEGRPSLVLKKHATECRTSIIKLKKKYGNPKFTTDDVRNL